MTSKPLPSVRSLAVKVPEVTAYFWAIKVLSTTVGETFADYLNETLGFGLTKTSLVMTVALLALLLVQVRSKKYIPVLYWGTVVLMSITGTLLTDNLTDSVGVSLFLSSAVFAIALAATFALWRREEGTLDINSIDTRRREIFYWFVILFTFSLGTASGDLISEKLNLGYGNALLVFVGVIGVIAALWKFRVLGAIAAFWATYIMTRPLGASIGDFMSQAKKDGGLGIGTTNTSYIFLAAILALVAYLTISKRDVIEK